MATKGTAAAAQTASEAVGTAATAAGAPVVISEFRVRGPNGAADEFVELYNRSGAPVDVGGWLIRGSNASGSVSTRATIRQGTVIPANCYYLAVNTSTSGGPYSGPTPGDVGFSTGITDDGGIALTRADQSVVDAVGMSAGSAFKEGTPLPNLGTANQNRGYERKPGGVNGNGQDTNDNAADFHGLAPSNPQSSISRCEPATRDVAPSVAATIPANGATGVARDATITVTFSEAVTTGEAAFSLVCATSGTHALTVSGGPETYSLSSSRRFTSNEPCTVTVRGASVTDSAGQEMEADYAFSFRIADVFACGDPATKIHAVQGSGAITPLSGQLVTIEGIVVADLQGAGQFNGYYVQEEDADADGDPATSEGVFVFAGSSGLDVSVGDVVRVRGMVSEFKAASSDPASETQISATGSGGAVAICSRGASALPTEVTLPFGASESPERYEGMLVRLSQSLVIAEYFDYDRFGEVVLALPIEGESRPFTPTSIDEPGGPALARLLANQLRRITLDDGLNISNPSFLRHPNGDAFSLDNRFRGGDTVTGATGALGYRFNRYRIQPTAPAAYTSMNVRPTAPAAVGGTLRVAAFNTLNFFITGDYRTGDPLDNKCGPARNMECRGHDADQANEFTRQRAKLLAALVGLDADVVGLNELENTEGVDPLEHPDGIVPGLNDQLGAGTYASIETETIGTDAIKVGLIYKPAKVRPVGSFALLTSEVDPRFIDTRSRPALAQTFEEVATGARFTVVVNHLKSKGSACAGDPDTGDGQGNCNLTRKAAAEALVDWVATDPTGSGDADFLIIGDLNSYAQEDPIDAVRAGADDTPGTGDDYTNLISRFMGKYAYSYGFDGMFGYLDHALSNATMTPQVTGATEWHINADEPDVLDYDTSSKPDAQDALYEPNAFRSSDHDPVLVGLRLSATYADLRRVTREWVTNSGVAESLVAKLNAAEAAAARGNVTAKNGALGAYRNELEAQSGKTITAERARTLIRLSSAL